MNVTKLDENFPGTQHVARIDGTTYEITASIGPAGARMIVVQQGTHDVEGLVFNIGGRDLAAATYRVILDGLRNGETVEQIRENVQQVAAKALHHAQDLKYRWGGGNFDNDIWAAEHLWDQAMSVENHAFTAKLRASFAASA